MKHEAFYSTAAQVIPVIFIILAFQAGYFTFTPPASHGRRRSAGFAVYRLGVIVALAQAEFLALSTLEHAHDGGNLGRDFILYAIFFAGMGGRSPLRARAERPLQRERFRDNPETSYRRAVARGSRLVHLPRRSLEAANRGPQPGRGGPGATRTARVRRLRRTHADPWLLCRTR
jgi:hypothetical protein